MSSTVGAETRSPPTPLAGGPALVIVTKWEQFRALDLSRLKAVMARPVVVDLRNIYPPAEMAQKGFVYRSIGRPPAIGLEPKVHRVATE